MHLYFLFRKIKWLAVFSLLPFSSLAETKFWTGSGGDAYWANPLNWSGNQLPIVTDDVILDNSFVLLSFQVILPDPATTIKTLQINPTYGRNIELVLPASNKVINGLTVTGPGYGIQLNAGAVFRNASGITSGESLSIADSLIIYNGARYIHQTRASHANNILRILSSAPGTEMGIFDFDVPRASYTISVSNRVYGCLELHATALGSAVNYTCSGANPLLVRGDLRIGQNVSMSMNLSGSNGNVQISGDYIQEGGLLNLATGSGSNTLFRIKGNLSQQSASLITKTGSGSPVIELNGTSQQQINLAGELRNQIVFNINNPAGGLLLFPLKLPWKLKLTEGALVSSTEAMLTLDTACMIVFDSSRQTGTYVEGPLCKLGLKSQDNFIFPVGKSGNLRWLALSSAQGNFIVEYVHNDPAILGTSVGAGLDHVSKLEYWTVQSSGQGNTNAKIELSFASAQCGGVTDPQFLNVAMFQNAIWENAGHSGITGDAVQGSVSSGPLDFGAVDFTLASTANLENPLPVSHIDLSIKEISGGTLFRWVFTGSETPDHFDLEEEKQYGTECIAQFPRLETNTHYQWVGPVFKSGDHFFRIRMIDIHGGEYISETARFNEKSSNNKISWLAPSPQKENPDLVIEVEKQEYWQYEILSVTGSRVGKGQLILNPGRNIFDIIPDNLTIGIYILVTVNTRGERHALLFRKN
jgi:hypothetical protein